jgi:5'-nucleotidase
MRIVVRLTAVTVALSLPVAFLHGDQRTSRTARSVAVQLLAINDFHGNIEPPSGPDGRVNATVAGGVEYLATHISNAMAQNPNSIVVSAGDVIGASPFVSSLFHDEPTIEAMNAMRLAVSSVGNHEFDEGPAELLRMKRGGCHPDDGCQDGDGFAGAAFEYLSANVIRTATRAPLFPPTAIRTVGGVKIGFIGETLKGTPRIVSAAGTRGLTFLDEAATANAYAARLKRQSVQAIVLLIHQGGRQRPDAGDPDPNGCANFGGGLDPVLEKLSPDIQVVVAGHSHVFYNCLIGNRLVTSAGSYGRMITRVTLDVDTATDRITSKSAVNEIVTRDVVRHLAQTRILQKYSALADGAANKVVGSVTADLTRAGNAAGESQLGDVIADAQLAATSDAGKGGAVVAFMNSGGIRSNIVANNARPAARAGEVTYRDLFSVQPFGNVVTVITMTGDMIKRLLEQQFDNPRPGANSVLQVSNGFTYRYRLSAPAGQRVDVASIMIGGRHIGPTDRIRVATLDFLVEGGGGYSVLGEGTDKLVGIADINALVAYFKARSPIAPPPQDRIVRIE